MSANPGSFRKSENRLRAAYSASLERSPELRREVRRSRRRGKGAAHRLGKNLLMPLFWACIFLAVVHKRGNLQWASAIIALWAAGTACKWAHQWFQQFYASEDLVVLNLLPLNDAQIFRFQLRRYLAGAAWIAWDLFLCYGVLAFLRGADGPPLYALFVAALAQSVLVLALAIHAASFLHMLPLGALSLLFRATALGLLFLGLRGLELTPPFIHATEWFLPTGWVNYVLLQSDRDWSIFALAIPIGAIIYLARYSFDRLRAFYSLEGFEFVPGPSHLSVQDMPELDPDSVNRRAGPTEIEERIRARYFLEGVNWNLGGPLEAFIGRLLPPRERVVTEFLVAQNPGWTRSFKFSFWIWLIACGVVLALGRYGGTIVFFAAYVLGAASLPVFGGEWRGMRQTAAGGVFIPGYSLYPISFNEIARIFIKVNLVRTCAAAPFIISFAALAAYTLKHPPFTGAIIGAKMIGILLAIQPMIVLFPISATTNATYRMLSVWIFIFAPLFIALLAACLGVFIGGTVFGVSASYALLLLFSFLIFVIYRRAYRKGRFDLLSARARGEG